MVKYMEREFGERALNGDKASTAILRAKVADLESRLEEQRAAEDSSDDNKPKSGSEHETDDDVSNSYCLLQVLMAG